MELNILCRHLCVIVPSNNSVLIVNVSYHHQMRKSQMSKTYYYQYGAKNCPEVPITVTLNGMNH